MFSKFSRRHFAKLAGWSALGLTAAQAADDDPKSTADRHAPSRFPDGFLWGTATSAYQVEGAVHEDGRSPSIWDIFTHIPGKIADQSNADRANDHYHRYKEDVSLMKALGARTYRFSIAWPRVFPEGTGAANPKGLDFYDRLIDELLLNDIEPFATLYHWDLPQSLQDRFGGWQSSETSKAFGKLCGLCGGTAGRSRQECLHAQRTRAVRKLRIRMGHRRAWSQIAAGRGQSSPPPRRAGPWPRGAGDPRPAWLGHQGRTR